MLDDTASRGLLAEVETLWLDRGSVIETVRLAQTDCARSAKSTLGPDGRFGILIGGALVGTRSRGGGAWTGRVFFDASSAPSAVGRADPCLLA